MTVYSNDPDLVGRATAPTGAERRHHTRFPLVLRGVCSIAGGPDIACTTLDLSLGGVALRCPAPAAAGDRVVLVLPRIGFMESRVVRALPHGFAAAFAASQSQRTRLSRMLEANLAGTGSIQHRPSDEHARAAAGGPSQDEPWSLTRMLRF